MTDPQNDIHIEMLRQVAVALGDTLCSQMTFVGGCTTGLLLTDDFSREQVRHTDDVDLIVSVIGYGGFGALQAQLRSQGFKDCNSTDEDAPLCAMKLGELRVDFMPDDESVLGFSNCWYQQAMESANQHSLDNDISINLISPVYFVATKLEAYCNPPKK